MKKYKKHFGDRNDGRLIRTIDPFFRVIPYIMKTRTDSQTFFEEKIDLTDIEPYIKSKRGNDLKNIGFLHIIIAALVRTISQNPGLNRFVAGQKLYARDGIFISLAVKKQLLEESPETTIKVKFEPTDTIYDVVEKLNKSINENKKESASNDTDKTAHIIALCPGFVIKFAFGVVNGLDYHGCLPKFLNDLSPFHTSAFITDLGSVGIQPVFHHIYNFGTTSIFIAFGNKQKEKIIDKDNNIIEKKYIDIKIVTDERIADGFYFAKAFKCFKSFIMHPEKLELPPEKVIEDLE